MQNYYVLRTFYRIIEKCSVSQFNTDNEILTCPDLREFSSIFMRLAEFSSGVPAVGGRGPAPTDAGRPIEAEDGDRELVGVRLL